MVFFVLPRGYRIRSRQGRCTYKAPLCCSVALRQGRVDFHLTGGEFVMASISERENREIEAANASGNIPVVFIHGLWLLPSSWANWADFFKQAGYAPLTPDWPDDPETAEEARANPDVLAQKTLKPAADHTTDIINASAGPPVAIAPSAASRPAPKPP